MRSKCLYILSCLIMVLAVFPSRAIGKRKDLKPYLEVRIDRKNVVEGERLIYEVALVSPEASVAGVELLSTPDFGELPYSRSAPDNNLTEVVVDGDKYYTAVIDRYFVGVNNKGKNSIKGGVYKIGFDRMVKVQYPFWGATVQNRLETMNLKASDVTLKVSPLPEKGRPDFFSGAVGQFEIMSIPPEGKLRAGEDYLMTVNISGIGDLTDTPLPDIRSAFPPEIQFKSMTEDRSHYVKAGKLGSEIELECVIHPKKGGEYVVKEMEFTYFNPFSGKYEVAKSPEVKIFVDDSSSGDGQPPVIIDV